MKILAYELDAYPSFVQSPLSLLFFSARWCGTCRGVARSLAALPEDLNFQVMMLDAETEKAIADSYDVLGVPVLILLKNGIEQARHSGSTIYSELIEWLRDCGIDLPTPLEQ